MIDDKAMGSPHSSSGNLPRCLTNCLSLVIIRVHQGKKRPPSPSPSSQYSPFRFEHMAVFLCKYRTVRTVATSRKPHGMKE